jgi:hypothetical protein
MYRGFTLFLRMKRPTRVLLLERCTTLFSTSGYLHVYRFPDQGQSLILINNLSFFIYTDNSLRYATERCIIHISQYSVYEYIP